MDINYTDFYAYEQFLGPQMPSTSPRPPRGSPTLNSQQAPTASPPSFTPTQQTATSFAVDPRSISLCLF